MRRARRDARDRDDVAVVLADQWLPGRTGTECLARAAELYPSASGRCSSNGGRGDRETADAILRAMALGQIDYYLLKPWRSPDELFHRTLSEFIHEWAQAGSFGPRGRRDRRAVVSAGARAAHPAVPERRPARLPFPRLRAGPVAARRGGT